MKIKQDRIVSDIKKIIFLIFTYWAISFQAFAKLNKNKLELIYSPQPYFPIEARTKNMTGFVEVEINFNDAGLVIDIDVIAAKNRSVFIKSVLTTVAEWKIKPIAGDSLILQKRFSFNLVSLSPKKKIASNQSSVSGQAKANEIPWSYESYKKKLIKLKKAYKIYIARKHALSFRRQ